MRLGPYLFPCLKDLLVMILLLLDLKVVLQEECQLEDHQQCQVLLQLKYLLVLQTPEEWQLA